jgi:thiamine biosynthesis lipoprotein
MSLAVALAALLASAPPRAAGAPAELQVHRESRALMGTRVDVVVEGVAGALLARAADAAYKEMTRLSDMMNHYDPGSVVSEINRQAGVRAVPAPPELMSVLVLAQRMSVKTGGAFDITVGSLRGWRFNPEDPEMPSAQQIRALLPLVNYRDVILDRAAGTAFLRRAGMRIDLGGIAKLYILHAGMDVLKRAGIAHAMINGGGDVEVAASVQGHPWRIGIRDPRQPDKVFAVLERTHGFVVSSGDYERYFIKGGRRYHHILDPKTGYPTQGPRATTLVADDLELVDGLSASIMVLGMARGRALVEATPGLDGMIFAADGSVWVSSGLRGKLQFLEQR